MSERQQRRGSEPEKLLLKSNRTERHHGWSGQPCRKHWGSKDAIIHCQLGQLTWHGTG